MKTNFILLLLCTSTLALAQYEGGKSLPSADFTSQADFNDPSYRIATTINQTDLKKHLFTLASDEFEGRETGTAGNAKAAEYIAGQFRSLGLNSPLKNSTYYQEVAFTFSKTEKFNLNVAGHEYKNLRDVLLFPQFSYNSILSESSILFAGYGIEDESYDDYKKIQGPSKVFLALEGEPRTTEGIYFVSGNENSSNWTADWRLKARAAKKHGAEVLLLVVSDLRSSIEKNRNQLLNQVTELGERIKEDKSMANVVFISPKIAEEILAESRGKVLKMREKLEKSSEMMSPIVLDAQVNFVLDVSKSSILGQNVMGFIEGTDKKDEIIVVSAHYDHIGKRAENIFNGADDNASGSSAVIEIAEALALSKKLNSGPRRSILFLLVTGEEKGLLGSMYYSENPVLPLANTVADVNIDMIGRKGNDYKNYDAPYLYVIGSDRISKDLHRINEDCNNKYSGMLLDYSYNAETDPNRFYYRSDHYNFAKKGIPSIFFFSGVHEDYHGKDDIPEKIDYALLEFRSRHIFHLIWSLANRDNRLSIDARE